MDYGGFMQGSESQDSDEPAPPGTRGFEDSRQSTPSTSSPLPKSLGVENAKKRLRAFSIQKKTAVAPVPVVKPVSTGNTTVLIGKLSSVKVTPKVEKPDDEQKKLPKPPKPGARHKYFNESYTELQKQTVAEIEDMKRKMELVELGIPLGLVCPSTNAIPAKVMPTKAMPPIKTFLDTAKIDAIIREAKKAKAEGKEFKFDYQKFVPDYDNPFQRKKETEADKKEADKKEEDPRKVKNVPDKDKTRRKIERFDRRHDHWKDDKDKYRDKEKYREKDRKEENRSKDRERSKETVREIDEKSRDRDIRSKERDNKSKDRDKDDRSKDRDKHKDDLVIEPVKNREDKSKDRDSRAKDDDKDKKEKAGDSAKKDKSQKFVDTFSEPDAKETKVNLNDYYVCDSWSLDNDDKNTSSPQVEDKTKPSTSKAYDPLEDLRNSLRKKDSNKSVDSPKPKEKLKPVLDSFNFELDPNDDDDTLLDIFDEDSDLERYSKKPSKKELYDSPAQIKFGLDREAKETSNDGMNEDTFLESVINELKQEHMSDDEHHDKGLVEYDDSPVKSPLDPSLGSVTPELDDSVRLQSQRSDYSDGYRSTDSRKSTESGYKSTESGFRSTESGFKSIGSDFKTMESDKSQSNMSGKDFRLSVEKELDEAYDNRMSKDVVDSLETWSFVLKICQPLLFRHDKNKCYKETRTQPKVWYTQNPKLCSCVKDRSVVYEELEMCKMNLVDRVYGCDQIPDAPYQIVRGWYPPIEQCLVENPLKPVDMCSEWDIEERRPEKSKQRRSMTPEKVETLDREYQRFIEAVEGWPEEEVKEVSRSTTPVRLESRKKKAEDREDKEERKKAKKMKLSSGGWSQESDVEEEKAKPAKPEKVKNKRKRKHSSSTISSESVSDEGAKKRKKVKDKEGKKVKSKAKRRRLAKKMAKKLKEKKKKKKLEKVEKTEDSELEEEEKEIKKKDKKLKKKKQQKLKKKLEKKKKRARSSSSSSSSSSSDSSSDTESETDKKTKKKKKKEAEARKKKEKKKKSKQHSISDSAQSEELFDVNVLNNMKTERVTDDERVRDKSPVRHREIINVRELHEEFSSNAHAIVRVKQEVEDAKQIQDDSLEAKTVEADNLEAKTFEAEDLEAIELPKEPAPEPEKAPETEAELMNKFDLSASEEQFVSTEHKIETVMFKEPEIPTPPPRLDESSQCSSQESICSIKDQSYEKDDSHLRPSSQNSNYSFNDVMAGQGYKQMEDNLEGYENYDMYEQMAMAYQSDVASQQASPPSSSVSQRIETVVGSRVRGEIKCDWRASDPPAIARHTRPSRWGLKPGEVNIVLTGQDSPAASAPQPVYKIQSLANRTDTSIGYDEAYMDMYGASDKLQYGDCFASAPQTQQTQPAKQTKPAQTAQNIHDPRVRSLDDRINIALRDTILGEVAKDDTEKETPEKGILVMKSLTDARAAKRVSFADGYKPGQDSDVEEPPVKKRAPRRYGCAWPCPATHPDHVPLWDALPPPPPPPGSPPPPAMIHHTHSHHANVLTDLSMSIQNFMPPKPPPGILNFA